MMSQKPLVLVTGGTGFLAIWVIVHLFREGYRVRTTVRTTSRIEEIKSRLREASIDEEQISSLEVVQADLLKDTGWESAVQGVTYVQHVASPFPAELPNHEDDLIKPARDGTVRVLQAARDSKCVTRVVITSSFAAVGYGHSKERVKDSYFTEKDWTNLDSSYVPPYPKSKTLAELAAWDFIKNECKNSSLELTVVNPVGIYGPALGQEDGTSLKVVSEFLEGNVPGIPRLNYGVVDVRDCAELHLMAMTSPRANGERFICIGEGSLWLEEVAKILKENLGLKAKKVPTMVLPNMVVRGLAFFMPVVRLTLSDLGREKKISNAKAKEVLGWQWKYTNEEAVLASADSAIKFGFAKI